MKRNINLTVSSNDVGQRVDSFISKKEIALSRTRVKNLIIKKKLFVNNRIVDN